jgi:hypothetical protein
MGKFKRNIELEKKINKLALGLELEQKTRMFSPVSSNEFVRSTKSSVTSHECDDEVGRICKGFKRVFLIQEKWMLLSHLNCLNL